MPVNSPIRSIVLVSLVLLLAGLVSCLSNPPSETARAQSATITPWPGPQATATAAWQREQAAQAQKSQADEQRRQAEAQAQQAAENARNAQSDLDAARADAAAAQAALQAQQIGAASEAIGSANQRIASATDRITELQAIVNGQRDTINQQSGTIQRQSDTITSITGELQAARDKERQISVAYTAKLQQDENDRNSGTAGYIFSAVVFLACGILLFIMIRTILKRRPATVIRADAQVFEPEDYDEPVDERIEE